MGDRGATTEKPRRRVPRVLLVALLPALLYANTLVNSFQYDDVHYIQNNRYVHSLSGVGHFFVSSRLMSNIPLSGYRPLTMSSFALNYAVGADSPFGYHLVNVALHVLNTLLVYAVALALMRAFEVSRGSDAALAAALLFACHPVNTQPVNYISARSTLLAGGFSLLCFLLYARRREPAGTFGKAAVWAGSLAAYACALLSKEEAVALPGLLAAYELCRLRLRIDKAKAMRILFSLLPFIVLTLGFIVFVVRILGIVGDTAQARGVGENLLTQAGALFFYLKLLALPTTLSIDHVVATASSILDPAVMASVIGAVVILVGPVLLVRSMPVVPFGIWWFALALVPSSTLVALKLVVNEQRLYLPAVGILFISGAAFGAALDRVSTADRQGLRRALVCGLAAVLVVFGALTVRRNAQWRTPFSLWTSALEEYPDSARANTQMANLYIEMGRFDAALEAAKKAVEAAPDVSEARMALAVAYSRLGLQTEALEQARAAVDLNPASTDAQTMLGAVYARLGRYREAEAAWERALELDPENVEARENLEKLKKGGKG